MRWWLQTSRSNAATDDSLEVGALIRKNQPKAFENIREIWRSALIPYQPDRVREDHQEAQESRNNREFFPHLRHRQVDG